MQSVAACVLLHNSVHKLMELNIDELRMENELAVTSPLLWHPLWPKLYLLSDVIIEVETELLPALPHVGIIFFSLPLVNHLIPMTRCINVLTWQAI